MQIRNSKLCESSKCRAYSAVNNPWWMCMFFHRRGCGLARLFFTPLCTVNDFLKYLLQVRERSLTTAWLKSGPDRTELMESRKICYDNEKDFRFKLNAKNKKVSCKK